jgi:hypothetical protein
VSVRLDDGTVSQRPLRQVTSGQVVNAAPWRSGRSARGQVRYPGLCWSATTGGHVIYESRLELARLLLADFDPDVLTGVTVQDLDLAESYDGGHYRGGGPIVPGRGGAFGYIVRVIPRNDLLTSVAEPGVVAVA